MNEVMALMTRQEQQDTEPTVGQAAAAQPADPPLSRRRWLMGAGALALAQEGPGGYGTTRNECSGRPRS